MRTGDSLLERYMSFAISPVKMDRTFHLSQNGQHERQRRHLQSSDVTAGFLPATLAGKLSSLGISSTSLILHFNDLLQR